ncbi:hypothetical protein [Mesorhizobium sp.]|uniref:hypothetical protein n=1 Tax=Mesorhizobium TaxID=68287 RepID=UPI00338E277C
MPLPSGRLEHGQRFEPIGSLSKGSTSFLHGSRIDFGLDDALKPIRDPDVLRTATSEQFAERAGQVLAELNYVHPMKHVLEDSINPNPPRSASRCICRRRTVRREAV